jgi:hypothetical protein
MHTTSHGIARTVATTIAIGAVLAPAAAAQQDLRSPDTRDAAERAQRTQDLRSPDTRDAAERAQRTQDFRMPDTRDAAAGRGTENAPVVEFVDVPEADGFDVSDAALGAAAGIGFVLIGVGGATATVRIRRRPVGARLF